MSEETQYQRVQAGEIDDDDSEYLIGTQRGGPEKPSKIENIFKLQIVNLFMNGFILLFLFWLWRLLTDAQALAAQADRILHFMKSNNTEISGEVELVFINCPNYCSTMTCDWTREWSCPWDNAEGLLGWATDAHSEAYQCCCEHRKSATEPCGGPNMVLPSTEFATSITKPIDCASHCSIQNCDWTSEWSCPWEERDGFKGRAISDGTDSFECCCKQRQSLEQSCGGARIPALKPIVSNGNIATMTTTTTAVVDCARFCMKENCRWTKKWSCPWHYGEGKEGRAVDDGTVAYNCCCIQRQSHKQPCGGHRFTTTTTIRPSKSPVTSSLPTKCPSRFPTKYVDSSSSTTSATSTIPAAVDVKPLTESPILAISEDLEPAKKQISSDVTAGSAPLSVIEATRKVETTDAPKLLLESKKAIPDETEGPVLLSEKKQDDTVEKAAAPILLSDNKAEAVSQTKEEIVDTETPIQMKESTTTTRAVNNTPDNNLLEDKSKLTRNVPSPNELLESLQREKTDVSTNSERRIL